MLSGNGVILQELSAKYFPEIITWRNDKELNRYINQPFELTMELEEQWYRESYAHDNTQKLYVMLDREKNIPFGTMGYVNLDLEKKLCISARLIVGNREYQGSPYLIEGLLLFFDYLYNVVKIETIYSHVVKENLASLRIQKRLGFVENEGQIIFPERLHDSAFPMVEIVGTKERYEAGRKKVMKLLEGIL